MKEQERTISTAQSDIDDFLRPASFKFTNSFVHIAGDIQRIRKTVRNVIAVIPGSDRTIENEWLVIGAHYDHLGIGREDPLDPLEPEEIYPGRR